MIIYNFAKKWWWGAEPPPPVPTRMLKYFVNLFTLLSIISGIVPDHSRLFLFNNKSLPYSIIITTV